MSTAAIPPVDMELKKAFQELQLKMIDTTQKLKLADIQIDGLKRSIQHSKLTNQEISALPEGIRTYEGVGRMFLLTDTNAVTTNLQKKMDSASDKIKSLEGNKTYLERNLKESEDNLRELIISKKAM